MNRIVIVLFVFTMSSQIGLGQVPPGELPKIEFLDFVTETGKFRLVEYDSASTETQGKEMTSAHLVEIDASNARVLQVNGQELTMEALHDWARQAQPIPVLIQQNGQTIDNSLRPVFSENAIQIVFAGEMPTGVRVNDKKKSALESVQHISHDEVLENLRSKDGVFRFVIGAASNIPNLASSRSESSFQSETETLLQQSFLRAVKKCFPKNDQAMETGQRVFEENNEHFSEVVKKSKVTHRFVDDSSVDLAKGYVIAELSHEDLLNAMQPAIKQLSQELGGTPENLQALSNQVLEDFKVGWGGNPYRFMIMSFDDPIDALQGRWRGSWGHGQDEFGAIATPVIVELKVEGSDVAWSGFRFKDGEGSINIESLEGNTTGQFVYKSEAGASSNPTSFEYSLVDEKLLITIDGEEFELHRQTATR